MIEVEKKCIPDIKIIDAIRKESQKTIKIVLEDKCLDFQDLRLIKNDIWLRCRNGRYDLKKPILRKETWGDIYEEIEDEKRILDELKIESFLDTALITLSHLITKREEFLLDPFTIVLDQVVCPENNFQYNLMEIELLVNSEDESEEARKEIDVFMKTHNIPCNVHVDSKFIAFIKDKRPDIYVSINNQW